MLATIKTKRTSKLILRLLGGIKLTVGQHPTQESVMPQAKAAQIIGVSRSKIYELLEGTLGIGPVLALKISKHFNITAEEIVIANALDLLDMERVKQGILPREDDIYAAFRNLGFTHGVKQIKPLTSLPKTILVSAFTNEHDAVEEARRLCHVYRNFQLNAFKMVKL